MITTVQNAVICVWTIIILYLEIFFIQKIHYNTYDAAFFILQLLLFLFKFYFHSFTYF